jgi:multiple sugar transport system ATP-binding protein
MRPSAAIEISHVVKRFGDVIALRDVSISIPDGSFVALVGPSGCGKTTLLRAICGLEDVTAGEIYIGGDRVTDRAPKDRDIAMVFQSYALYPHLDVAGNMGFSLKLARTPKATIEEKVQGASGILGLGQLLQRLPRQLSGGQRQRVAMGRAIVRNPRVFLFDEPLSNLDAKLRVQMRKEIKQLHQRLRVTSVFVTHDQVEAMTLADRVVVMNGGRVEQVGAPLELYDRPNTPFVAGFIGSPAMNLLEGRVRRRPEASDVVLAGDATLPLPPSVDLVDGASVIYGVRPEHLRPTPPQEGAPATVNVVEPTGCETFVYCTLPSGEICVRTTDRLALAPDDRIGLRPDLTHVHLFDPATGARLN